MKTSTFRSGPLRSYAGSSAVQSASVATALVLTLVIGRRFGADGLGVYAFATSTAALAGVVAHPGLANATIVAEARGEESFGAWALRRRAILAPATGLLILLVDLLPLADGFESGTAWAVLAVVGAAQAVTSLADAVLTGRRAFGTLASVRVTAGVSAVLVALALPQDGDPTWIAVAFLGGGMVSQAWVLRILSIWRGSGNPPPGTFREFGREMSLVSVISGVEGRLDVFVVGGFDGAVSAGTYVLARRVAEALRQVWVVVHRVVLPRWSREDDDRAREESRRLALRALGMGLFATLAAAAGAGFLADAVFGAVPDRFVLLASVVVATAALGLVGAALETYFASRATGRPVLVMRLMPATGFLLFAGPVGVAYGALGVAWLRLGKAALGSLVGVLLFRRTRR